MIEPLYLIFAAFVAIAALLAVIAIGTPRSTPLRAAAVLLTATIAPFVYLGLTETLSRPKPMSHEWFNAAAKEAIVLGVSLEEGKAIYLWLRVDGSMQPRYYRLPWQQKNAELLQRAVQTAAEEDVGVRVYSPFSRDSWTNQGELNIEFVRPPTPPLKLPTPPPQLFNPRQRKI